MHFRNAGYFSYALTYTFAPESAWTDGEYRRINLIVRAKGFKIRYRITKETPYTVFFFQNQQSRGRDYHKKGAEKIAEPYPRDKKHKKGVKRKKYRSGKIILQEYQYEKNTGYKRRGYNSPGKNINFIFFLVKEMGQVKRQNQFNQFGRLERKTGDSNPPRCPVFADTNTGDKGQNAKQYAAKHKGFNYFS